MAPQTTTARIHGWPLIPAAALCLLLLLGVHSQSCEARPGRYRRDVLSCPLPTGLTCANLLAGSSPATTSAVTYNYVSTTPQTSDTASQTEQEIRSIAQSSHGNDLHPLEVAYHNNIEPDSETYKVLTSTEMQQEWSLKTASSANTLLDVVSNYFGLFTVHNCSIHKYGEAMDLELNNTNLERVEHVYGHLRDMLHLVCGYVGDADKSLTDYKSTTTTMAPLMLQTGSNQSHTVRATFVTELALFVDRLKKTSNWEN